MRRILRGGVGQQGRGGRKGTISATCSVSAESEGSRHIASLHMILGGQVVSGTMLELA